MKVLHKNIKNVFSDLIFEPERHYYFLKGKYMKSVSKTVETFVEPFDESYWLPICAKKEKMSEHDLQRKWQMANWDACELGTKVHNFLEKYQGYQRPTLPQEQAGISFLKKLGSQYEIVAREFRGYNLKFGYAGTMDLLLRNKKTGKLIIADYKTNGDLFKSFRYMKAPFDYLENNPYNHYQIQLSLYQGILMGIKEEVEDRWLVHLKADSTYDIYHLYDFTKELSNTFKMRMAA